MSDPSSIDKIYSQKSITGYQTINDKYSKGFGKTTRMNKESQQPKTIPISSIEASASPVSKTKNKNGKIVWMRVVLIIFTFFVIAILKNPSAPKTKVLIKETLVEKINDKMSRELSNEDNTGFEKIGIFLSMSAVPHLLENFINISVSDYVIFSTFNCTAEDGDEIKTIVSGIVIFGKVIPLTSDLSKDTMEFN